jgi:hypothetical protein
MITDEQKEHYTTASGYLVNCREKKPDGSDKRYPLCRGDIMQLVVLIDQELKAATPIGDLKRFRAIREKLGDVFFDSPEMTREEAQQFR